MANYDYIDQALTASCLIQPFDDESFFHPEATNFTGFAFDGTHYTNGAQDAGPVFASWFTEAPGPYRAGSQTFPTQAIVILSGVAMTIMDTTNSNVFPPLWMQFLIQNDHLLADNFTFDSGGLLGWTPTFLNYSNGVISVICLPDAGSNIQSKMILNIDFVNDTGYMYLAT